MHEHKSTWSWYSWAKNHMFWDEHKTQTPMCEQTMDSAVRFGAKPSNLFCIKSAIILNCCHGKKTFCGVGRDSVETIGIEGCATTRVWELFLTADGTATQNNSSDMMNAGVTTNLWGKKMWERLGSSRWWYSSDLLTCKVGGSQGRVADSSEDHSICRFAHISGVDVQLHTFVQFIATGILELWDLVMDVRVQVAPQHLKPFTNCVFGLPW